MAATMTEDEMRALLDWQEADAHDVFSFETGHTETPGCPWPEWFDEFTVPLDHHLGWTRYSWERSMLQRDVTDQLKCYVESNVPTQRIAKLCVVCKQQTQHYVNDYGWWRGEHQGQEETCPVCGRCEIYRKDTGVWVRVETPVWWRPTDDAR